MTSHPPATLTFVGAPTPWINANARLHWSQRAKLTRYWRDRATVESRKQALPTYVKQVDILATFQRTDARRWDAHNLYGTVKAVIDGLVRAGVLYDDSGAYVRQVTPIAGPKASQPTLTLTITEVPE